MSGFNNCGDVTVDMQNGFTPVGGIILWSGAIVSIPTNWQLCDGTNGTPNLTDMFVVGAGNSYNVGATGGSLSHSHRLPFNLGTSALGIFASFGTDGTPVPRVRDVSTVADTTSVARALSDVQDTRPPYYALAFIMRIT